MPWFFALLPCAGGIGAPDRVRERGVAMNQAPTTNHLVRSHSSSTLWAVPFRPDTGPFAAGNATSSTG